MNHKPDPVTVEVVNNALLSIAEQMGMALIRSAYSTNIKERKDCSCALFDAQGNLIALAEHIPIHLGSMQGLMKKIADSRNTWNFHAGDVIIANDPYHGGGSHLPDITLVQPVFHQERLVAFTSNIAHWSDVGGRSPGIGTAGDSTELLQEGLRIPPTLIIDRSKLREDVLSLILLNMRNQKERLGDFRAQIASLKLGERHLTKLFNKYTEKVVSYCIDDFFKYSRRRLEAALKQIPEGTFLFMDKMDDDGITQEPLAIRVKVTVVHGAHPSIHFDFSGTAPQARGGINMVWQALQATVLYSVKAIFGPDIPMNAGFQHPIRIDAPEGCLVNAQEPAAVGGRTDTCQRVVDAIMGALSQADPKRVISASTGATTAIIFGGTLNLTGKDFVYVEALGGGMGARSNKDGIDGIQVHITNTSNLPIEALELEYPLRVTYYKLMPDTGGAGRFRGGLSIQKGIQALKPVLFSAHSDRHKICPWGLRGGSPGLCGKFTHRSKNRSTVIASKISGVLIEPGDILDVTTAGGGGFGYANARDPEMVQRDYRLGKISRKHAQEAYGVVLAEGGKIKG